MSNRSDDPDRDPSSQIFVADAKPGVDRESADAGHQPRRPRRARSGARTASGSRFSRATRRSTAPTAWSISRSWPPTARARRERVKAAEDLDRGVSAPRFSGDGKTITVARHRRSIGLSRCALPLAAEPRERLMSPPVVGLELDAPPAAVRRCCPAATRSRPRSTESPTTGRSNSSRIRTTRCSQSSDRADRRGRVQEQGRHRGARPADEAGRLRRRTRRCRCCCGFTAARTGRSSTRSASSVSGSRRNGYAVLAVNYRGSAGRGTKFSTGDLRRLGPLRSRRSAGRRRSRRSRWASPIRIGSASAAGATAAS